MQNSRTRRRRFTWAGWRTVLTIRSSTPTSQSSASSPEHSGIQSLPIVVLPISGSQFFPSLIPDLHQRIFSILTPKKWFLSSQKFDPGCSSRIRTFYPTRIPDPAVKKAPDPGSGSATLLPILSWLVYFDCIIRL